jgi:hypothetical protein
MGAAVSVYLIGLPVANCFFIKENTSLFGLGWGDNFSINSWVELSIFEVDTIEMVYSGIKIWETLSVEFFNWGMEEIRVDASVQLLTN